MCLVRLSHRDHGDRRTRGAWSTELRPWREDGRAETPPKATRAWLQEKRLWTSFSEELQGQGTRKPIHRDRKGADKDLGIRCKVRKGQGHRCVALERHSGWCEGRLSQEKPWLRAGPKVTWNLHRKRKKKKEKHVGRKRSLHEREGGREGPLLFQVEGAVASLSSRTGKSGFPSALVCYGS